MEINQSKEWLDKDTKCQLQHLTTQNKKFQRKWTKAQQFFLVICKLCQSKSHHLRKNKSFVWWAQSQPIVLDTAAILVPSETRSFVKTTELATEYASANAHGGILECAMNYLRGYQTKKVKEKGGLFFENMPQRLTNVVSKLLDPQPQPKRNHATTGLRAAAGRQVSKSKMNVCFLANWCREGQLVAPSLPHHLW